MAHTLEWWVIFVRAHVQARAFFSILLYLFAYSDPSAHAYEVVWRRRRLCAAQTARSGIVERVSVAHSRARRKHTPVTLSPALTFTRALFPLQSWQALMQSLCKQVINGSEHCSSYGWRAEAGGANLAEQGVWAVERFSVCLSRRRNKRRPQLDDVDVKSKWLPCKKGFYPQWMCCLLSHSLAL